MDTVLKILGTLGIVGTLLVVWQGHQAVASSTLHSAWKWLIAAVTLWGVAWTWTVLLAAAEPAIADQAWYGVSILMLCPLVAVLGARRPVTRVWTWFVLVPLMLVLSIPLVSVWTGGMPFPRLELESPATLGYLLVLVMGTGNYFGTRFTVPALLLAMALVAVVIPFTPTFTLVAVPPEKSRLWATVLLAAAAALAFREGRRPQASNSPFDRLWLDFRDFFGIVWAKRVQDRVNQTATTEKWPVRLELHGLVPNANHEGTDTTDFSAKVDHAFRWLFRRFAEPEWIDQRMRLPSQEGAKTASEDDHLNDE